MAIELLRGYDFIYAALAGDATLTPIVGTRIFPEVAPQGTPYPFIVYQYLGGADLVVLGGVRVETNGVYLVKAVAETRSYTPLRVMADRIDTLLHRRKGAAGVDGQVFSCVREAVDPLPPEYDASQNREFRSIAARYRLAIQV